MTAWRVVRPRLPDGVAEASATGASALMESRPFDLVLAAGWLDDAALFPPGELPLPEAVVAHVAHRAAWYGAFVGPFVCAVRHLALLSEHLPPDRLAVSLVGSAADLLAARLPAGVRLASVEVSPQAGESASAVLSAASSVRAVVPAEGSMFVELPWTDDPRTLVEGLAKIDVAAKLRTGGLAAAAFPSAETLAAAISACVLAKVPFKATAGLHRAVAHTAATTGFAHHGFLNILLACEAAPDSDVVALLRERDEAVLLQRLSGIDLARARERFLSFGTCSVTEPVEDLLRLGLVRAPVAG